MSIVDKIQALRRLSENQSATPAEAASAAARIQELMIKHAISEAELGIVEDEVGLSAEPVYSSIRVSTWRANLAQGIARLNGCRCVEALRGRRRSLKLVGRASDIAMAEHLYHFVSGEIERLAKEFLKVNERVGVSSKELGKAYRLGCVRTIIQRIEDQAHQTMVEARQTASSTALVVIDARENALAEFMRQNNVGTKEMPAMAVDSAAYHQGKVDATRIAIHRPIDVGSPRGEAVSEERRMGTG